MRRRVKSASNAAPCCTFPSPPPLLLSLELTLSLPRSITALFHPPAHPPTPHLYVCVTSITWVKAADPAPLKVTTPNCSQLRFNKSMNIYQSTCLRPESKCCVFAISLRTPLSAAKSSGQVLFASFGGFFSLFFLTESIQPLPLH